MRTAGNILWLLLAGVWLAIGYVVAGIISCILVVTIPFGIQSFKLAGYALWPFGRMVVQQPDRDVAPAYSAASETRSGSCSRACGSQSLICWPAHSCA